MSHRLCWNTEAGKFLWYQLPVIGFHWELFAISWLGKIMPYQNTSWRLCHLVVAARLYCAGDRYKRIKENLVDEATFVHLNLVLLTNSVVEDLSWLQPKNRTVNTSTSTVCVYLCLHLKKVTKINDFCDWVQAEQQLYMCDGSLDGLQTDFETSGHVCAYWQKVSESEVSGGLSGQKYESLSHVAKAALILSHSNAVLKRGFLVNMSCWAKRSCHLLRTLL